MDDDNSVDLDKLWYQSCTTSAASRVELEGDVSEGSDLDIADISTAESSGSESEDKGADITGRQENHATSRVETVN